MIKIATLTLLLLAAGCGLTPQGDAVRQIVAERTARAAEAGLENAEWFMCEGAPIGAVKKRYAGGRADAYNELCDTSSAEELIRPAERLSFPSGFPEVLRQEGNER